MPLAHAPVKKDFDRFPIRPTGGGSPVPARSSIEDPGADHLRAHLTEVCRPGMSKEELQRVVIPAHGVARETSNVERVAVELLLQKVYIHTKMPYLSHGTQQSSQ